VADLVAHIALARSADFAVDVELHCPPGITCIMGPSGSGKSTILAVLAGLTVPDRGRIAVGNQLWLDRDIAAGREVDVAVHRRRLSYVFQGLALFPHMSAQHNVEYGMHDVPRGERAIKARALLDRLGVGHLAKRRPRTFSGGEAQRVALARALARSPELVLLDEPFSALDRELRAQLTSLVRELSTDLDVPIVHVTHSIAEARQLADQIIRVDKGRVVARGRPDEVLAGVTTLEE
jgi:molybdate transport system ATP-binding protein